MIGEGPTIKDSLPLECYADGAETLLSRSPCGTVQTWAMGRGTHIEILELVDPTVLLNANAAEANTFSRNDARGELVKVASVPTALRLKMLKEQWDQKDLKRWLNDGDNAKFRTTDAKWRV